MRRLTAALRQSLTSVGKQGEEIGRDSTVAKPTALVQARVNRSSGNKREGWIEATRGDRGTKASG